MVARLVARSVPELSMRLLATTVAQLDDGEQVRHFQCVIRCLMTFYDLFRDH
ncbi:MAG: hypothetical protein JWQ50_9211 [Caballeronia mineralivorans]|jgi:hypothetical protein|nr:hypothetical protein [Caballeronia mineralivorans]MEA3104976.1 hypothetical protein [Caballeronia mineralivorans]